ncbi:MAG TPA: hypothetical protein V6D07_10945, partial [Trichocoleus sp.]
MHTSSLVDPVGWVELSLAKTRHQPDINGSAASGQQQLRKGFLDGTRKRGRVLFCLSSPKNLILLLLN